MKNVRSTSLFSEVISLLFIFLFTYVAISKFIDHYYFESVLSNSPLIGWGSNFFSGAIPAAELLLVLLLISRYRALGLLLTAVMMSVFTLYVAYMILFVPQLPCSCGGIINKLNWKQHLVLNTALTLVASGAWMLERNKRFIAINRISRTPV